MTKTFSSWTTIIKLFTEYSDRSALPAGWCTSFEAGIQCTTTGFTELPTVTRWTLTGRGANVINAGSSIKTGTHCTVVDIRCFPIFVHI